MTESVARLQSFINDVKAADVPRVRLKQEAQGRANCQLSSVGDNTMAQSIRGNGNIQIIATELQIISEHPILLQFASDGKVEIRSVQPGELRLVQPPAVAAGQPHPALINGDDQDV